jgi:hypothetical protein
VDEISLEMGKTSQQFPNEKITFCHLLFRPLIYELKGNNILWFFSSIRLFLIIFFVIDIGEEEEEDEKQRVVYNPDMIQLNKLYYSPVCYHSLIICFVLIFHGFVFLGFVKLVEEGKERFV